MILITNFKFLSLFCTVALCHTQTAVWPQVTLQVLQMISDRGPNTPTSPSINITSYQHLNPRSSTLVLPGAHIFMATLSRRLPHLWRNNNLILIDRSNQMKKIARNMSAKTKCCSWKEKSVTIFNQLLSSFRQSSECISCELIWR